MGGWGHSRPVTPLCSLCPHTVEDRRKQGQEEGKVSKKGANRMMDERKRRTADNQRQNEGKLEKQR